MLVSFLNNHTSSTSFVSPSTSRLISAVNTLAEAEANLELTVRLNAAISLLNHLSKSEKPLEPGNLDLLHYPNHEGQFLSRHELYYNDSSRAELPADIVGNRTALHPGIGRDTALFFQIDTVSSINLGLLREEDGDDDIDMEEALTTRIRNVLRQYAIEQAFPELLANAVDAGASSFRVVLDETTNSPSSRLIAAAFSGPTLVVYNDAVFKDQDWNGLKKVGLGGKEDDPDLIGRFGLGALSIYHFSEVCT